MLNHRVHLLLDDERYQRITAAANERKVSVATVIREAIDCGVPTDRVSKREAAQAFLAAQPMSMPDPAELKAEIAAAHDRFDDCS
jgi:hypothetical protein